MTDDQMEKLLRQAPPPKTPAGLLDTLRADIPVPGRNEPAPASSDWWTLVKRWLPVAACFCVAAAVIGVQSHQATQLRRENEQRCAATPDLEALRQQNQEYQRLRTATQEWERLERDNAEVHRLRAEVAQLRAQLAEREVQRQQTASTRAGGPTPVRVETDEEFFARVGDGRARAESIMCINNLKQIGLAARVWANDNGDVLPSDFISMKQELNTPKILCCPSDKGRTAARNWEEFSPAQVSYEFLSPGASETEPEVVIVRCPVHGHVCLADGSVQQGGRAILENGKWTYRR